MSLNIGQIPHLTTQIYALERLKNSHILLCPLFALHFYSIFFILAGSKDNYNASDELIIRPDPTIDCGVNGHLGALKNPHRLIMGEMLLPV